MTVVYSQGLFYNLKWGTVSRSTRAIWKGHHKSNKLFSKPNEQFELRPSTTCLFHHLHLSEVKSSTCLIKHNLSKNYLQHFPQTCEQKIMVNVHLPCVFSKPYQTPLGSPHRCSPRGSLDAKRAVSSVVKVTKPVEVHTNGSPAEPFTPSMEI